MPKVDIKDEIISTAMLALIKGSKDGLITIDEDLLIRSIKSKNLSREELDKMAKDRDLNDSTLGNLKIFLMESRGDYLNAFRLMLQTGELKNSIFTWIDRTFEKLTSSKGGDLIQNKANFEVLSAEIKKCMQDLLKIKVEGGVALVDRWFDFNYQERLITVELKSYKDV